MRGCLRVLAVLILIPTVFLLLSGVLMVGLRITTLTPTFWQRSFVQHGVYSRLPDLAVDLMLEDDPSASLGEGDAGTSAVAEIEKKFGREAVKEFLRALIPPAWSQNQVEHNIDAVFAWLEGDTAYPYFRLELGDLSQRLAQREGREAVRGLLGRLPPCEPGEDFLDEDEVFPHCRPPDPELDEAMEEVLPELEEELPGDLSFRAQVENGEVEQEALDELRRLQRYYRFFNLGVWLVWLVCLVLLGLAALMAARNLGEALQWVGWPLLVAGGLGLLLLGIIFLSTPLLVDYWITQWFPNGALSVTLAEVVAPLLRGLIQGLAGRGLMLTGGLALLGLLGVIAGALIRPVDEYA